VANSDTWLEADRAEILRLHELWMRANCGLHIDAMREVFVGGAHFQGFNLNGHTYFQFDEWAQLWTYLRTVMQMTDVVEQQIINLEIRADTAYLTFEATAVVRALPHAEEKSSGLELPVEPARLKFRGTEIYLREDENQRRNWKMWHCHYSAAAPSTEARPGFFT